MSVFSNSEPVQSPAIGITVSADGGGMGTGMAGDEPDVVSSTDLYAQRFAGAAGAFLLQRQSILAQKLLKRFAPGSLLDVGGGHAQLAVDMKSLGFDLTISGSTDACRMRPDRVLGADGYQFLKSCPDHLQIPDDSFDVAVALRLLAHLNDTDRFIAGLCRVARHAVLVDFATPLSFNALTPMLFGAKQRAEIGTRKYLMQRRSEIAHAFDSAGWELVAVPGQFFWPMVLHRKLNHTGLSRGLEFMATTVGLRAIFGSPRIGLAVPKDRGAV